jgi:hypothetical protein
VRYANYPWTPHTYTYIGASRYTIAPPPLKYAIQARFVSYREGWLLTPEIQ